MTTDITGFPDDNIDPRLKNYDWIMQYCKAAWTNTNGIIPNNSFFNNVGKLGETKAYGQGRQSVDKYKKTPLGSDIKDNTWLASDFTPVAIIPKFREMMIAQILQRQYDLQAFAVDPISKSEEDIFFNQMKTKILMRQAAQGTPMMNMPALKNNGNEPDDMEQLAISQEYGYKSEFAMNAEEGISLIMQQNNIYEKRKRNVEALMDAGIGGYKLWIDENGMCKFKEVNPEGIISSYCRNNNFDDAVYLGECYPVMVADLVPYFDAAQIDDICDKALSNFGNPTTYYRFGTAGANWKKFRVMVMDLQFISWNRTAYKNEINSRGNDDFIKVDFKYTDSRYTSTPSTRSYIQSSFQSDTPEEDKGQATPKFIASTRKVIYKGKWIINSDYLYDYGVKENQNRKLSSWWDTQMDYYLYAWNFYEMNFTGITERLIPLADRYQLVWQKIQNIDAKMIPYVMNINFTALESVKYGKNGETWTPAQIMEFIMQNYAAVYRTDDLLDTQKPGFQPVTFQSTPQLTIISELIAELQFLVTQMYEVSGLNQAVAGNPDPKTLTTGLNLQQQATNNALYLISQAEKSLYLSLGDAIVQKIQIAVKLGKVEGYGKALGSSTVKFFQINPDISTREFGIFIDDAPTREQRTELLQEITTKETQGLLSIADRGIVEECRNIKMAWRILGYKVRKKEEQIQAQKIQAIQTQNQGNQDAAIAAEKEKQKTLKLQGQIQLEIENTKGGWQYQIESMKKASDRTEAEIQADAKKVAASIAASAKQSAQSLLA